jgi:hypothetical protein
LRYTQSDMSELTTRIDTLADRISHVLMRL